MNHISIFRGGYNFRIMIYSFILTDANRNTEWQKQIMRDELLKRFI